MTVRHITTVDNVDPDGYLIDAAIAHHGSVVANRISALGGPIDPTTHLNDDFGDHELGECVIAAALHAGAAIVLDDEGQFAHARPRPGVSQPRGRVSLGERRSEWLAAIHAYRNQQPKS